MSTSKVSAKFVGSDNKPVELAIPSKVFSSGREGFYINLKQAGGVLIDGVRYEGQLQLWKPSS